MGLYAVRFLQDFSHVHRDAIEACDGLDGAEGDACFLTFGLDCQQTRRWFSTVATLESALALPGVE